MNTLAHLALGYPDPESMLGQFLGDHVKGPVEDTSYPAAVQQGIRAHRRVDATSDQHDLTRFAKSLLPEAQRRFAGIVLDLYTDALLADHWADLMPVAFDAFLGEAHQVLAAPPSSLPASAERYAASLRDFHLLEAYADVEELPEILDRMGNRLRRPMALSPLLAVLRKQESAFQERFPGYFRDMQALC